MTEEFAKAFMDETGCKYVTYYESFYLIECNIDYGDRQFTVDFYDDKIYIDEMKNTVSIRSKLLYICDPDTAPNRVMEFIQND